MNNLQCHPSDTAMILYITFEAISRFHNFFSRSRSKEAAEECSGDSHLGVYPLNGRSLSSGILLSPDNLPKPFTFQERDLIPTVI